MVRTPLPGIPSLVLRGSLFVAVALPNKKPFAAGTASAVRMVSVAAMGTASAIRMVPVAGMVTAAILGSSELLPRRLHLPVSVSVVTKQHA